MEIEVRKCPGDGLNDYVFTFFRSIAHVCVDTLLRGPFGLIVKASR